MLEITIFIMGPCVVPHGAFVLLEMALKRLQPQGISLDLLEKKA